MKKTLLRVITLVLTVTFLFSGISALASSDLVVKKAKLYSSSSLSKSIGTIPAWTSITVTSHTSSSVYKVKYKGKTGYVRTSCLVPETLTYTGSKTLRKGTRVYQRPTTSSASIKAPKTMYVLIIGTKGSWTLARTDDPDYDAIYIFVKTDKLS